MFSGAAVIRYEVRAFSVGKGILRDGSCSPRQLRPCLFIHKCSRSCRNNLGQGLCPVLVTDVVSLAVAEWRAANTGLDNRVDIFEIEQFVALNLYELGNYDALGRKTAATDLFER